VTGYDVMSPLSREELINNLSDEQAASIARVIDDSIVNRIGENSLPSKEEQFKAISVLTKEYANISFSESDINRAPPNRNMGDASRKLLLFISANADSKLMGLLDKQLENPPDDATASTESLAFFMPVVLSGCMGILTLISGSSYKNGKWEYDPIKGINVFKTQVKGIVDILKNILPFDK
jgi:hypothetical protein